MTEPPTKRRKTTKRRPWETDETVESVENAAESAEETEKMSEREIMALKKRFELFSSGATLLMANGDHNVFAQTRETLSDRIRRAEGEQKEWEYRWMDDATEQSYGS